MGIRNKKQEPGFKESIFCCISQHAGVADLSIRLSFSDLPQSMWRPPVARGRWIMASLWIIDEEKHLREERVYFTLQLPGHYHWRTSGQELKVGTWRQERKQMPWKSAASWLAQPAFLEKKDHLSRVSTSPSKLGPPTPIINQENASYTCLTSRSLFFLLKNFYTI